MPLLYPRPVEIPTYSQRMFHLLSTAPVCIPDPAAPRQPSPTMNKCAENIVEVDNALDAMDELFKLVTETMSTDVPIILRCNIPTWQDANAGLDLYDFRALQEKSLVFVHGFIDRLKNAGYQASYKLTMSGVASNAALVRVSVGNPFESVPQNELDRICGVLKGKLPALIQRDRLYVTTLCNMPSVAIA